MEAVDVEAPMPGTVLEVMVSKGDTVGAEDELLIVESMKMEVPITAPAAGTVSEVLVSDGVAIAEGDVLMRISTG